ncbi:MAG: site-specific integrase [Pseudomonadota bacterium]
MVGKVEHKDLSTAKARKRLKAGRQPHFQSLVTGRSHLGYQRNESSKAGRWMLRRYEGRDAKGNERYVVAGLGWADDDRRADGTAILSYEQAKVVALALLDQAKGGAVLPGTLTVRTALARHFTAKVAQGKDTRIDEQKAAKLILPPLGNLLVAELTSDTLRKWLASLAKAPALQRSSKREGAKQNTKAKPQGEDAIRKRRASANRTFTILRAALNFAYKEGDATSDAAWRRVEPFSDVDHPKIDFLEIDEAKRLINAAPEDFRKLVMAGLQTGCRYGELCRLKVSDFSASAGTVLIQRSKSGKSRHVVLSVEGINFFRSITTGRRGDELMLTHDDGRPWKHGEQSRAMREATKAAKLRPIGFHILRHTYGSLSVMGAMPLPALQQNLGHADLRMTMRHYGHLSEGFMKSAVRDNAPTFGFVPSKKLVGLRS